MHKYIAILAAICALVSCGTRGSSLKAAPASRAFPAVEVPVMMEDPQERMTYVVLHFWDSFAKGSYPTDTLVIAGVQMAEMERQMGIFSSMLQEIPLQIGEKAMTALYKNSAKSPEMLSAMAKLTAKYFFDPNSPVRSEALYLPFVSALSSSELITPELQAGYQWDARMCALNRPGTVATDFRFIDTAGHSRTLHGIKSEYILLIFGNPDCKACRELVEAMANTPEIEQLERSGRLKVVDVFIDREVDVWKERMSSYPKNWINGYDPAFVIRDEHLYNVRAIPSIYLLDSSKTVILKDAPEGLALDVLTRL